MYLVSCICCQHRTNTCKRNVRSSLFLSAPSLPRTSIFITLCTFAVENILLLFFLFFFVHLFILTPTLPSVALWTAFLNLAIPLHLLRLCFIPIPIPFLLQLFFYFYLFFFSLSYTLWHPRLVRCGRKAQREMRAGEREVSGRIPLGSACNYYDWIYNL